MILAALLACCPLLCPQDPLPEVPPAHGDIIRLKLGTEFAGRITSQTEDFVMIELGPGNVVGFAMEQVDAIVRGAAALRATPELPAPLAWFRARDDWFVLHDAAGRGVGTLHETATRDEEGRIRLGEEWRFFAREGRTDVTRLEVVGEDGVPVSSFVHERSLDRDERVRDERIVRAVVGERQIVVTARSLRGEDRRSYDFGTGTRFPLELRAVLRAREAGAVLTEAHPVFDVLGERFHSEPWSFGALRRVPGSRGDAERVREIATPQGREWLDAAGATLRREINGPALVAVPCAESDRQRLAQSDQFPPALVSEPGGSFAMWLPSPAWAFEAGETDGQLSAVHRTEDAAVSLVRFDHLDAALALPSATDAVLRWLALVQPGLQVIERSTVALRGVTAERVRARYDGRDPRTGAPLQYESLVHVVRAGDRWFAACGSAPRSLFAQVEDDLIWIAERFELAVEGFSAEPRGPLRKSTRPGKLR